MSFHEKPIVNQLREVAHRVTKIRGHLVNLEAMIDNEIRAAVANDRPEVLRHERLTEIQLVSHEIDLILSEIGDI